MRPAGLRRQNCGGALVEGERKDQKSQWKGHAFGATFAVVGFTYSLPNCLSRKPRILDYPLFE